MTENWRRSQQRVYRTYLITPLIPVFIRVWSSMHTFKVHPPLMCGLVVIRMSFADFSPVFFRTMLESNH